MIMTEQRTVSPYSQEVVYSRPLLPVEGLDAVLRKAAEAQQGWRQSSLQERQSIVGRWTDEMNALDQDIRTELALQMGRLV